MLAVSLLKLFNLDLSFRYLLFGIVIVLLKSLNINCDWLSCLLFSFVLGSFFLALLVFLDGFLQLFDGLVVDHEFFHFKVCY